MHTPDQVALATVVLLCPLGKKFQTFVCCERFDACELAQNVSLNFPGHIIMEVHWQ